MNTGGKDSGTRLQLPSSGKAKGSAKPGCEDVDIETRVQQLEDRWQELNNLPTTSEMFRRLRKFRELEQAPAEGSVAGDSTVQLQQVHDSSQHSQTAGLRRTCHPMSELWHSMQLLNQVETNTEGITRVRRRADFYTFVLYCHISLSFGQIHRRYKNLIF